VALSVHAHVAPTANGDVVLDRITQLLVERFDIHHGAIQIERSSRAESLDHEQGSSMEFGNNDAPGRTPDRSAAPAETAVPRLKPERPVNPQRDARMLIIVLGIFLLMIVAGVIYSILG
jgi:hypothetical protein